MRQKINLNELRQTKDSYYVVPKFNKTKSLNQIITDFNSNGNQTKFDINQVRQFLSFIKEKGYELRQ
ncbi:MAG: hypothetical protein ACJ0QO_00735 [Parvicellaceae bacterium]|tara:strand:- start:204 stop:404 length:201 start_codon:yes stop_codon:yes gene_type:complete